MNLIFFALNKKNACRVQRTASYRPCTRYRLSSSSAAVAVVALAGASAAPSRRLLTVRRAQTDLVAQCAFQVRLCSASSPVVNLVTPSSQSTSKRRRLSRRSRSRARRSGRPAPSADVAARSWMERNVALFVLLLSLGLRALLAPLASPSAHDRVGGQGSLPFASALARPSSTSSNAAATPFARPTKAICEPLRCARSRCCSEPRRVAVVVAATTPMPTRRIGVR